MNRFGFITKAGESDSADEEINSITTNIPTSFVRSPIKLHDDKGNGEAKLYLGASEDSNAFEEFFSYWNSSNVYSFDRENLLSYLSEMEEEFLKTDKYKQVGLNYFRDLRSEILNKKPEDMRVRLENFADRRRYYIRSEDQGNDFWEPFRRIALPLITEVEIIKFDDDLFCEYILYLWRSDSRRDRAHTRKGTKINLHPLHTRYIPKKLKREVDARDRRMCQANWRIDPSLDKPSGETCDSNEHLHYDHITPYSRGGPTTLNNLQLLCRKHNLMKSDKEL
jgi:hypothetical protein